MGTLAFLLTVAVVLVTLAYAVVGLVRRRPGSALRALGLALAWVAVYAVILVGVSLASRSKVLQLHDTRCFGKMCYSVVQAARTPALHGHQARGIYYVAVIDLHNADTRPGRPYGLRLWLRDANGHEYRQPVLGDPPGAGEPLDPTFLFPTALPPDQHEMAAVAFDVPEGIPDPQLVIEEGAPGVAHFIIGNDHSFLHGKTAFRLKAE